VVEVASAVEEAEVGDVTGKSDDDVGRSRRLHLQPQTDLRSAGS